MPALCLEGPPQYVPAVRAEVLHLQLSSQDLLRKPGLAQVQRAGRSRVCCCHGNKKFRLYAQSLEIEIRSPFGYTWRTATPRYHGAPEPGQHRQTAHGTTPARLSARNPARGTPPPPRPGAPRRPAAPGNDPKAPTRPRGPAARGRQRSPRRPGEGVGGGAERLPTGQSPSEPASRGPPRAPAAPPPPAGGPAAAPHSPAPSVRAPHRKRAQAPPAGHVERGPPRTAPPPGNDPARGDGRLRAGRHGHTRHGHTPPLLSWRPPPPPTLCVTPAVICPPPHSATSPLSPSPGPTHTCTPRSRNSGHYPLGPGSTAPGPALGPSWQQHPAPPQSPHAGPRTLLGQPPCRARPATPSPQPRTAQARPSSERSPYLHTQRHGRSSQPRVPAPTERGSSRAPGRFPCHRRRWGNTSARHVAVRSR